jgi:hypothetical protein
METDDDEDCIAEQKKIRKNAIGIGVGRVKRVAGQEPPPISLGRLRVCLHVRRDDNVDAAKWSMQNGLTSIDCDDSTP